MLDINTCHAKGQRVQYPIFEFALYPHANKWLMSVISHSHASIKSFKKRERLFEKRKLKADKAQHKPLTIIDIFKKSGVQMMPVHIYFKDVARLRVLVVGQGQPYPNVTQVFM